MPVEWVPSACQRQRWEGAVERTSGLPTPSHRISVLPSPARSLTAASRFPSPISHLPNTTTLPPRHSLPQSLTAHPSLLTVLPLAARLAAAGRSFSCAAAAASTILHTTHHHHPHPNHRSLPSLLCCHPDSCLSIQLNAAWLARRRCRCSRSRVDFFLSLRPSLDKCTSRRARCPIPCSLVEHLHHRNPHHPPTPSPRWKANSPRPACPAQLAVGCTLPIVAARPK